MTKILLFVPIVTMLLSCTVIPQALDGSQKINVRVWRDRTPNLSANALDNVFFIDNREETTVEFDVSLQDTTIFMAYTTDKKVTTINEPSEEQLNNLGLNTGIVGAGPITKVSVIEGNNQKEISYWRTSPTGVISGPIISSIVPEIQEGVWVRVFKGQFTSEKNPIITWSLEFATEEPMVISNIKIANIIYRTPSIVAVSNKSELIVFNDPDQNNIINFLPHGDTFKRFTEISQINSWENGNDTYISAIGNGNTLVTGFYREFSWQHMYKSQFTYTVSDMQVKMGVDKAYALWLNNKNRDISLMIYDKDKNIHNRWLEVDNINSGKLPYLLVNTFFNSAGSNKELVYSGIIDRNANYFQLFRINDFQMAPKGPIIVDWNERYGLGVNNKDQILFVRVQPDLNLIFAGLNSLAQWDSVQVSNPPSVRITVTSPIVVEFLNGSYPITFFIQENGSMYALGGEQ